MNIGAGEEQIWMNEYTEHINTGMVQNRNTYISFDPFGVFLGYEYSFKR